MSDYFEVLSPQVGYARQHGWGELRFGGVFFLISGRSSCRRSARRDSEGSRCAEDRALRGRREFSLARCERFVADS